MGQALSHQRHHFSFCLRVPLNISLSGGEARMAGELLDVAQAGRSLSAEGVHEAAPLAGHAFDSFPPPRLISAPRG